MSKKYVLLGELQPGMMVADDVFSDSGQLILAANSILTDSAIYKLECHRLFDIPVADQPILNVEDTESYYSKMRRSPEFREFRGEYFKEVAEIKNSLQNIMDNKEVSYSDLVDGTLALRPPNSTSYHMFDLLHNIRELDDLTFTHSVNVGLICSIMGSWLDLTIEDIRVLTLCGLLHDIGKLTIPPEILLKPSKLTPEEYEIMKSHTTNGYSILLDKDLDPRVKNAAFMHHERCNGTGYPLKLTGSKISSFAKIVSIADVYDAMTATRVYREPICPFSVIETFELGLDIYDPRYLMTFLENISESYLHNNIKLNNGEVGEIVYINKQNLSRPMVKTKNDFVDLAQNPKLRIVSLV